MMDKKNVEVTFISKNGLILLVGDTEYYLPYGKFPWFRTASVSDVFDVQMIGKNRIRWEALDIDLNLSNINNPDDYPLVARRKDVFALFFADKAQESIDALWDKGVINEETIEQWGAEHMRTTFHGSNETTKAAIAESMSIPNKKTYDNVDDLMVDL